MTGSETARAVLFVSLAILGCLIRTYIRTANGEKEDEVHFWSSRFSQLAEAQPSAPPAALAGQVRPRSTTTSSGEVSQAVSVLHDQPPRFAPFLADTVEPQPAEQVQLAPVACQGTEIDEAYEDWAAMHHARGAVSEDAEASIDKLWQRRQLQKAMGVHALPHLEPLGTSGANTPTIWTSHFPPAQLRPY